MWGLLLSTVLTSAADSLNPIAITQQFVLQGLVKKPKHIWYFIVPTGVTNLIGGFFAYYGLITLIGNLADILIEKYGQLLFTAELILGIAAFVSTVFLLQSKKIESLKKQIQSLKPSGGHPDNENDGTEAAPKINSVSPPALAALGMGATLSELTTALPYFAFLTILFNYQLTFAQVTFILVLYNLIYTSPLIILYFIYVRAQDKFDRLYRVMKDQIAKWASIFAPAFVGIIGVMLIYHSVSLLLK